MKKLISKIVKISICKIVLYPISVILALWKYRKISLLKDSVIYFAQWYKSVKINNNPLNCDQPWIVFKAKDFLDNILHEKMIVWEYGSGSSTLYFSRRVKKVYSIENDPDWYNHLKAFIEEKQIKNVEYHLSEAITHSENVNSDYISQSTLAKNQNFEKYVKFIDSVPNESLDMVIVDGRARSACIKHAMPKIKHGGYLVVDNSDRVGYFKNNAELFDCKKWSSIHFVGPVPYIFFFSKTSFFQKSKNE